MINLGDAVLFFKGDRSGLDATIKQVEGQASASMDGLMNKAQLAGAAMTAIGGGIIGFMGLAVKGAAEAEQANAQLEAVLKSTGGAAGLTKDQLNAMAAALQDVTTYDDEAITSAQSLLLTFTSIGKDVFPEAIGTILDMSTALGQDLKSSTVQLGKALNDPIQGITALSRVGVSFTEQQKEQIQVMVEAGDVMGAQRLILAELSKEFGGSAAAAADTLAGRWQQLKNDLGNLLEEVGNALSGGQGFSGLLEMVRENVKAMTAWIAAHPVLASAITKIVAVIGGLMVVLGPLLVVLPGIVTAFGLVSGAIGAISLPVVAAIAAITALIAAGWYLYKNWDAVVEYLKLTWERMKQAVANTLVDIGQTVRYLVDGIVWAFTHPLEFAQAAWDAYMGYLRWWWDTIAGFFQAGYDFIASIMNGIANGIGWIWDQLSFGYNNPTAPPAPLPRAMGGSVNPNQMYWVGEEGPELFVPNASGTIVPNDVARQKATGQLMGGNFTVNVNGMVVREEADIEKVSRKLYQLVMAEARA